MNGPIKVQSWWGHKLLKISFYFTQAELSYSQKRVCNELSKLKGEDTDVDENSLPPCSPTLEVCERVYVYKRIRQKEARGVDQLNVVCVFALSD